MRRVTGYEIDRERERLCELLLENILGRQPEFEWCGLWCTVGQLRWSGPQETPAMNNAQIYDPPKWKTLDMIEPGRESVFCVKVESLYGTPWALSRGGLTVWPELEVRMLHRRFCDAWDI